MKKSLLLLSVFFLLLGTSAFTQNYNRDTRMSITPAQRASDIVTLVTSLASNSQNTVYIYTVQGQTITDINTIAASSNNTILTITFIDNTIPYLYVFIEDVIGVSYTNTP